MDPPAVRKFLRQVGRELRDLGPFERHRALLEIRSDITDLAMDGHPAAPDKQGLDRASKSMASPREVAQTYLESAKPPLLMIELSLFFNLLLSLGCLSAGIWLSSSLSSYYGSKALPALFILLLVASGLFGLAVYGSAFVRPRIAARWRYAVLPAIVVAVVFDAILGTVSVVSLNWPTLVGILTPIATFFGGVYSIAYAHDQLPRLSLSDTTAKRGRDYYRILRWHLRDLDRARRIAIVAELQNHVASSGVDLAGLGAKEKYERIIDVLGPPDEITAGYLTEVPTELSRKQRVFSSVLLLPTTIGMILGAIILEWGLNEETFRHPEQNLTFLGMVGSIGLLIASIGALAGVLHVRRAPMHWPDFTPPSAVFALVAALIIAAVFGGLPVGGIMEEIPRKAYSINSVHSGTDGSLDVYWTAWSFSGWDSEWGIPDHANQDGSTITRLDQSGNILSSDWIPVKSDLGSLILFDRVSNSWVILYSGGLDTWGSAVGEVPLDSLSGWDVVDGRIDGGHIAVSWLRHNCEDGSMTVRSTSLTLPFTTPETWERTVTAPQVRPPWTRCSDSRITVGENRTLATVVLNDENSSSVRSDIRSYLFDDSGNEISNFSLVHEEVSLNGSNDMFNDTMSFVDGSRYVAGTFWVVGHGWVAVNGTAILRSWALRIETTGGSSATYELRRLTFPYLERRPWGNSEEGDPWFSFSQGTVADDAAILVVSVAGQGYVMLSSDGWRIDVTSGNLTASRLMADGSLDFAVSPYSIPSGTSAHSGIFFLMGIMVSIHDGVPTVFISDPFSIRFDEPTYVKAFTVSQPSHAVEEDEFTLGFTEALFFYGCLMQYGNNPLCIGNGAEQGTAELAGQALYADQGIFGWRGESLAFAKAPAILRLDARSGTSSIIQLMQPFRPSDTIAGLLFMTVVSVAVVAALAIGYPFLRAWRIVRTGRSERLTEKVNQR